MKSICLNGMISDILPPLRGLIHSAIVLYNHYTPSGFRTKTHFAVGPYVTDPVPG